MHQNFVKNSGAHLTEIIPVGLIMAITDQESTDAVARTPGAVGGATLSEIISESRPVNVLSFNGIQPDGKSPDDCSGRQLCDSFCASLALA